MDPFSLFKEELQKDEIQYRINAIHRINIVAAVLGIDAIKSDLIPYIKTTLMKQEEDEVLYALASQLITILPIIQDRSDLKKEVQDILKELASQEETVVRDQAVKSLQVLSNSLKEDQLQSYVQDVISLSKDDNNFTSRVSAVYLLVNVYKKVQSSDHRAKIRNRFLELCSEETPMVRRTVASQIGEFATIIEKEYVISDLLEKAKNLIQDDQDQVRVLGIQNLKQLSKVLTKEENKQHILQIILAAAEDKSWKVKHAVAQNIADLSRVLGQDVADVSLAQTFTNLLRDPENDVKSVSIQSLQEFVKIISTKKLDIIIPHLQYTVKDSSPQVRLGTIKVISQMAALITNTDQIKNKLKTLYDQIFNPSEFANEKYEVKEVAIEGAADFIINISKNPNIKGFNVSSYFSEYQTFIDVIKKTSQNPEENWRVRYKAFEAIVKLCVLAKNYDICKSYFLNIHSSDKLHLLQFIHDDVAQIRDHTCLKLDKLIKLYLNDGIQQYLVDSIKHIFTNSDSKYTTKLSAYQIIIQLIRSQNYQFQQDLVQILKQGLNDKVSNVRIFVLHGLWEIITFTKDAKLQSSAKEIVSNIKDDDREIRATVELIRDKNKKYQHSKDVLRVLEQLK